MGDNKDLWPQFRELIGLGDGPEEAADYLSQDAVMKFQEASEYLVDRLVQASKIAAERLGNLIKLREAIALAYNALLMGDAEEAREELRKVILL